MLRAVGLVGRGLAGESFIIVLAKGLRPHYFVELLMDGAETSGRESKPSGRGIEAVVIGLLGGAGGYTIGGILLTYGEHMWGGGLILAIGIVFLVSGLLLARVYGVNIWRENA